MERLLLWLARQGVRNRRDVKRVLDAIRKKGLRGTGEVLYYVRLLFDMLDHTLKGKYTLKRKTLLTVAAALLYFLTPTDAIFDFIPFAGYLDDISVLTYVMNVFSQEISEFRRYRERLGG